MKIYKLKLCGKTFNFVLAKTTYANNGTLAVAMLETTPKGKIKDDFGMVTVNINESNLMANSNSQFIDTNNMGEEITQWLVKNKIAKPVGILGFSGYCTYPLFEFNQKVLDEMVEY